MPFTAAKSPSPKPRTGVPLEWASTGETAAAAPQTVDLSIIAPMYNEEEVLDIFFREITRVLDGLGLTWEIVCVNDGSRDRTLPLLFERAERDPRLVVVDLSRNFGKEAALTAGLEYCSGAAVIPIDCDLQDPPEVIVQMVEKWREGYDVVYGARANRDSDNWLKRTTALAFYRMFNRITDVPIPVNTGDFRLMDRAVVEAVRRLPERSRFMKGVFAWVGFRSAAVVYTRAPRAAGNTKWRYWKLWNFALDGITSFTTLPLRVWSYVGAVVAVLAFVYALFTIAKTLILGVDVPGYASLLTVMLFLGGLQLLSLGVLGEYLGRTFQEVKQRPIYLVRSVQRGAGGSIKAPAAPERLRTAPAAERAAQ
ncbi:hypothetical protein C882_1630 [Caenispirillum salinarum AK4]|uniref:Glycosyltransferase 2-like domain-containing protein n=1 Tax=Caenispirillum salinarum AK4 TaxID=1238182 RepID=K9H5F0_9PROT|nr:glycosyltransferase family 2 protein [Caenispirillum salinarum]EKV32792.1 hypothetical protein C882_1630 [Caenispirillum salinarum AK4]